MQLHNIIINILIIIIIITIIIIQYNDINTKTWFEFSNITKS